MEPECEGIKDRLLANWKVIVGVIIVLFICVVAWSMSGGKKKTKKAKDADEEEGLDDLITLLEGLDE